ncbi:Lactonase, 7-bladed beta-propeller-domain-containing protein [Collybia nuda]|uniref:Lactonase, 7-bladed beta-propeller-domain-containing protein n=1 Tax=Collybia nuda TaxID=64659 RepID=A0A9P5YCI0_9AGAR|nr:Lactonase, 7-bladed beta-propeller-domain-containing protein [Collybia nuda]
MVAFSILAGGYDVFIATYLFNTATSSLSLVAKHPSGPNPSWISLHPTNRSVLYATNEISSGGLQSFNIDAEGVVSSAVQTISSGGDSPAFASALSTGEVAVFNYGSGNGRIVRTTSPTTFDDSAPLITFPVQSSTSVSHPHMALEYNGEVFVPDLGGDTIWRLGRTSYTGGWKIQGSFPQPKGSGPRHIRVSNNRLFALHELSSTLTVQSIPPAPNGTSTIFQSVSIVPPDQPQGAIFAAGEIQIPTPTKRFPVPYIYVSNRNVGVQDPRGDSIAIFEHVNQGTRSEGLKLVNQVFTGIDQIRGMEFGPADRGAEEFLVAAGVAGTAGTLVFKRTDGGRNLELVAKNLDIATRTSFVWV